MALQGTLDTFALADVLRLLAATTKTGRLQIDGDRGVGNLWLADGEVVAGTVELSYPGEADGTVPCTEPSDVLFELLRHVEGTFEFVPDEHSQDSRQPMAVDDVVASAEQKLSNWREVEAVVPSLDHVVTLAPEVDEEVVIGRDGWKTLLAIGEGRSVGHVGDRLGLGEIGVSNAVKTLVDERLAVIGEQVAEPETGSDASPTTTLEDVVADLGASPDLDVVVRAELDPGETVVDPASLGGSRAVDLDTALDSDETGHAYLEGDPDASVDMPEPLPAELCAVEPESAPEAPTSEVEEAGDDPEVERQLAQMSPRAAEAIAAAETGVPPAQPEAPVAEAGEAEQTGDDENGDEADGEQPMNRNLLMKFISSK